MTHAQCWDMHEHRADRLAGAASVDADVNVGSKKWCICELHAAVTEYKYSVLTQKKAI